MVVLGLGHVAQAAILADRRSIVSDIIQLNIFYRMAVNATSSIADGGVSLYLNGRNFGDSLLSITAKSPVLVLSKIRLIQGKKQVPQILPHSPRWSYDAQR